MKQVDNEQLKANLLASIDLMEFGVSLMRQNIARRLPNARPEQVDRELARWLIDQPKYFIPTIPAEDRSA